jgi:hypothetical protein
MRDRLFRLVARTLDPVRLDPTLRADLTALYRDDIVRLSELLDRDLSHWLAPEPRDAAGTLTVYPVR